MAQAGAYREGGNMRRRLFVKVKKNPAVTLLAAGDPKVYKDLRIAELHGHTLRVAMSILGWELISVETGGHLRGFFFRKKVGGDDPLN